MKVETIIVGSLEENCYLIKKGTACLVVDPGDEIEKILSQIGSLEVLGILITHHHFDHVGALSSLKRHFDVELYDAKLEEGTYFLGDFTFSLIKTPGHKEDCVSFYFPADGIMFVGDFVFYHEIGRCDLVGGDFSVMKKSIEKLKTYPEETVLYPGHGQKTNLLEEIKSNPYF